MLWSESLWERRNGDGQSGWSEGELRERVCEWEGHRWRKLLIMVTTSSSTAWT